MTQLPLLGIEHHRIVSELRGEILRTGTDPERPNVIVLRGSSGVGKSRIVRELYERLRNEAPPDGRYWPALPAEDAVGLLPFAERKRIGPALATTVWGRGALPTHTWWWCLCEGGTAALSDPLAQLGPQLNAHLLPAVMAVRRADGWAAEALGALQRSFDAVRQATAAEAIEAILAQANIPFASTLVDLALDTAKAARARHGEYVRLREEVAVGDEAVAGMHGAARDRASGLIEIARPEVPAIVAIEDLQFMSTTVVDFLTTLAGFRPERPVIVVATMWPECAADSPAERWMAEATAAGRVRVIDVPPLEEVGRREVVRAHAPRTATAIVEVVARHFDNVLALRLWLTTDRMQGRIQEGALEVSADDLARVPTTVRGMYWERWRMLPEDARRALMAAAVTLRGDSEATAFLADAVSQAIGGLDPRWADGVRTADERSGWLERERHIAAFRERTMRVIADTESQDAEAAFAQDVAVATAKWARAWLLGHSPRHGYVTEAWFPEILWREEKRRDGDQRAREALAAEVRSCAIDYDDPGVDRRVAELVADAYLRLIAGHGDSIALSAGHGDPIALSIASWVMACAAASRLDTNAALGNAQVAIATHEALAGGKPTPWSARARQQAAHWLADCGRPTEAIALLKPVFLPLMGKTGPLGRFMLGLRSDYSIYVMQAVGPAAAVERLRSLVSDGTRSLGSTDADTVQYRTNLGEALALAGSTDAACSALRALLADLSSAPPTRAEVDARSLLVDTLGDAGRLADAAGEAEECRARAADLTGSDAALRLPALARATAWTARAGATQQAIPLLRTYLDEAETSVQQGDRREATLRRRIPYEVAVELAAALATAGDLSGARGSLESAVSGLRAVAGERHPATVRALAELVRLNATAGLPGGH